MSTLVYGVLNQARPRPTAQGSVAQRGVGVEGAGVSGVWPKYGKPNVAIFNSFNFICSFVLCVQLCV